MALGACAGALAEPASDSRAEVRAIVAEMMADAETRSSIMAGGVRVREGTFTLEHDSGATLRVGGEI